MTSVRVALLQTDRPLVDFLDSVAWIDIVCGLRCKLGRTWCLGGGVAAILLGRWVAGMVRARRGMNGVIVGARRVVGVERRGLVGGTAKQERENGRQDQQRGEGCQGHSA